jgi:hypothetical protein
MFKDIIKDPKDFLQLVLINIFAYGIQIIAIAFFLLCCCSLLVFIGYSI